LIAVLADISDLHKARGNRYPLSAILVLIGASVRCGYRSYGAIAEWGRVDGAYLVLELGFATARTTGVATLHTIVRRLDRTLEEARLVGWAEELLRAFPPPPSASACASP
jgi:hypothetical protein